MKIKELIIKWLNKEALKQGTAVELSVGKVYLKPLTIGMVNRANAKACIAEDLVNSPMFFNEMDYELTSLSKKEIDNLSVGDGQKLRNAIRNVLIKEKVVKIEGASNAEGLSAEDLQHLHDQKVTHKNIMEQMRKEGQKSAEEIMNPQGGA